ncbi:patatin-like phospholipase domain-containing protein 4 isoform X1 [Talpa occidentalis]|uniref:patatin-like phospholipase domain-containing protein 4 isoform X1 n=1 Tax=Talpa occidentalis TaxID=50954 RepID=UPI00188FE102|nr:patatin-like phospholipase domain-containing protein 4 isoform X1 [Talpa occidentalis]XP_054551846.1 patatin-like phospholipase domain-containing protein 4 isoform X1 [Talpa occidentalis]
MQPISLSFAACGFLGIYHLGAAAAFRTHGTRLLRDVKAFAGASAGSLVASVLLTAPEKIEECSQFTYKFAEEVRRLSLGAATPGYDFMARLRSGMESILPPNAHELAHSRLHVSITNAQSGRNCLVSSFSSREELIKVLLASSFVPIYAGLKPVEYKGQVPGARAAGQAGSHVCAETRCCQDPAGALSRRFGVEDRGGRPFRLFPVFLHRFSVKEAKAFLLQASCGRSFLQHARPQGNPVPESGRPRSQGVPLPG